MSGDDHASQLSENSSNVDTQQLPFQIVLVDIRKAAEDEIHCVKFSLVPGRNLNYIAISYRWGELPETVIDTEQGYSATITSFAISSFCDLCRLIMQERDLCEMKYVWVDAICVNQSNVDQRRATMHHMRTIYECANYIVAVPDLHLSHLRNNATYVNEITFQVSQMQSYLYYLLQGNADRLIQYDIDSLDSRIRIAKNSTLSLLDIDAEIQEWKNAIEYRNSVLDSAVNFLNDLITDWSTRVWVISEYHIAKRTKNKKMKIWFIQLNLQDWPSEVPLSFLEFDFANPSPPLTLRFDRDSLPIYIRENASTLSTSMEIASRTCNKFQSVLNRQLAQQNFFEMMLKAKATKPEDRFYAVLPLSKYKKKLGSKDVVDSWQIMTTLAAKLKLLELMDPTDKFVLLFLSCNPYVQLKTQSLPTFLTTDMNWDAYKFHRTLLEVEQGKHMNNNWYSKLNVQYPTLTLVLPTNAIKDSIYKLYFKPKEYFLKTPDQDTEKKLMTWRRTYLCRRLGLDDPSIRLDIVSMHFYVNAVMKTMDNFFYSGNMSTVMGTFFPDALQIMLIGSFEENKWIFAPYNLHFGIQFFDWILHRCSNDKSEHGFYIY